MSCEKQSRAVAEWWKTWRNATVKLDLALKAIPQRKYELTQGLLLQSKEYSIKEFDIFEVIVYHVVKLETLTELEKYD